MMSKVKLARVKKNLKPFLRPIALRTLELLAWSEKKMWPDVQLLYSPVFIVAPPRSGTTLLYQAMTNHLSTCYFDNLAAKLYVGGGPAITIFSAKLTKLLKLHKSKNTQFESYYGLAQGISGPHEAHMIWDQRFPEDIHAVSAGILSKQDQQLIYRSVAGRERVFDRPFVNKCIRHSVRLEALTEIFPTAIFIQCNRDPLDTAQSIFLARTRDFPFQDHDRQNALEFWFSVKPKEYEQIKSKSLIEQVCEQVYYVEQSIAEARVILGEDRFLQISYEQWCRSPRKEIEKIVYFMNKHNAPTNIIAPLPESFNYSTGCKIDQTSYEAMANYLDQLYCQSVKVD